MTYSFAALRFLEDRNIDERIYWYLSPFPVNVGERVLAPVGSHNRLQLAVVEKTLTAPEAEAPYDMRLIKEVTAKHGARKLAADGVECLEFGGVKYDEKHYTPFGKLLLAREKPTALNELRAYGVTEVWEGSAEDPALYEKICGGSVLVLGEEGKRAFEALYRLLRGENKYLYDIGLKQHTVSLLKEKLQ